MPDVDAATLKSEQAAQWRSRAEMRLERAGLIEKHWTPTTAELLRLADVGPGDRVLDVGTGHGEPAISAARIVGSDGRVVGTDLSAEMIEVARTRAATAGLEDIEWLVEDGEALAAESESFDAVLCRMSLMFMPDPVGALRGMLRTLVPGGRTAIAVVGAEETQAQWTMTVDALIGSLGVAPLPPARVGEPGVYSVSDMDLLGRLFQEAGYESVEVLDRELVYDFDDPTEVVTWHQINPTIMSLFEGQSPEAVQAAWDAVIAAAVERQSPDGHVRIPSQVLYAVGRRPAR